MEENIISRHFQTSKFQTSLFLVLILCAFTVNGDKFGEKYHSEVDGGYFQDVNINNLNAYFQRLLNNSTGSSTTPMKKQKLQHAGSTVSRLDNYNPKYTHPKLSVSDTSANCDSTDGTSFSIWSCKFSAGVKYDYLQAW